MTNRRKLSVLLKLIVLLAITFNLVASEESIIQTALTNNENSEETVNLNYNYGGQQMYVNQDKSIEYASKLVPYTFDYFPPLSPMTPNSDPIRTDLEGKLAQSHDFDSRIDNCVKVPSPSCDAYYWFRQADGSCNNLNVTWWGQSNTPSKRLLQPSYQDSRSTPRALGINGRPLKNPREIALRVHYPQDLWKDLTDYVTVFGQFVVHDVSKLAQTLGDDGQVKKCTCDSTSSDCVNIPISKYDYQFKNQACFVQVRHKDSREDFNCDLGHREQLNEATAWLDLSQVYGTSKEQESELRAFYGGRLEVSYFKDSIGPLLPSKCTGSTLKIVSQTNVCFVAGDSRVNQYPLLSGIHTIWLRQHNLVVAELAKINPQWDDERLFQEGKRIVIAIYQNIIYAEWLPLVIGYELHKIFGIEPSPTGYFTEYTEGIFPGTTSEFSGAAARFGHTLVRPYVSRASVDYRTLSNDTLRKVMYRPDLLVPKDSLDEFMRGCLADRAWQNPPHINSELTDWAIVDQGNDNPTQFFSLPALNINRGREIGLQSYNYYRQLSGLNFAQSFDDLSWISPHNIRKLKSVYKDVNDIDLYPGALSEHHVRGGVLGPTFAFIIARAFRDWKYGDRWFYENDPTTTPFAFTATQLSQIRNIRLSSVICNTLNIKDITNNAFVKPDKLKNPYVPCSQVYQLDLTQYKDWSNGPWPAASYYGSIPSNPSTVPSSSNQIWGATAGGTINPYAVSDSAAWIYSQPGTYGFSAPSQASNTPYTSNAAYPYSQYGVAGMGQAPYG